MHLSVSVYTISISVPRNSSPQLTHILTYLGRKDIDCLIWTTWSRIYVFLQKWVFPTETNHLPCLLPIEVNASFQGKGIQVETVLFCYFPFKIYILHAERPRRKTVLYTCPFWTHLCIFSRFGGHGKFSEGGWCLWPSLCCNSLSFPAL